MATAQYLVGIDLGTTNTVVAYCEIQTDLSQSPVSLFEIDQLVGPGEVVRKPLLPSFRYHPAKGQVADGDLTLPWDSDLVDGDIEQVIIGEWARELGAKVEGRQVSSAKSWLSHQGVDRQQEILPWAGATDVDKVSPVVASASYLNHIKQAWNHRHQYHRLEHQDVVITVPASFDESARKLTLQAAKLAGLPKVHLLEEPQAVCYDWYARHNVTASHELAKIPLILVCDVGGGTTDLSLIAAKHDDQQLVLNRIGVGEHLMLGGDNLDLALAHLAEQRLHQGNKLNAANLSKLITQTRTAKEALLSASAPEELKITMLGSGSKLIGGTKSIVISRDEVHQIALEGFFPKSSFDQLPDKKRSAVVEFGLPYVSDPAVTKHIAEFLTHHQQVSQQALNSDQSPAIPVGLLLNGGVFNSELVSQRLTEILTQWNGSPVQLLDNPHPDWSVALGAVAFAKARRGAQLKIGGGSPRSYFLHLQEKGKSSQALCLLAKGNEEGQEIRLSGRRFSLTLAEPVRFNLLTSTHDFIGNQKIQNGLMLKVDPDNFAALPPYITTLQGSDVELAANQKQRVEVILACQLTEVGTLKLECVSVNDEYHRWQLEFEVRSAQSSDAKLDIHPGLQKSQSLIASLYSGNKQSASPNEIKVLTKNLEKLLGKKDQWDSYTIRALVDSFNLGRKRRKRSELHEKTWLRMTGFCMRPGYGDATDAWRMEQIWSLYNQGIQFQTTQGWSDWWVFWRRVSGGLNQEQQESILADIAKYLHPGAIKNAKTFQMAKEKGYEAMVRLSASLENLYIDDKVLLSTWYLNKAINSTQFVQAHWWALGRLASRTPLYGSQHNVVPREQVEQWLERILPLDWSKESMIGFACTLMCRKTGDRSIDIQQEYRDRVLEKLKSSKAPQSWIDLVIEVHQLNTSDAKRIFGDTLPTGLQLISR